MDEKTTLGAALDEFLAGVPELQALQRAYSAEIRGLSLPERLRWLDLNLDASLRSELMDSLTSSGDISVVPELLLPLLDKLLESWTETGAPSLVEPLVNPDPVVINVDGIKTIVIGVSVFSDLEGAIERLRDAYWREFPGSRPTVDTLRRMAAAYGYKAQGFSAADIAWEFLCDENPDIPRLPRRSKGEGERVRQMRAERARDYAVQHRRMASRVRQLFSRELNNVTQLAESASQNQD